MKGPIELVASLLAALLILAGCGPSIWTVSNKSDIPENFDGALLSYALASGEVQFSAAFNPKDDAPLSITSDQAVKAVPDYNHMHVLAYNHESLSSDDVSIDLDGPLLKQLSSTTEDKSVATILAVNALLTQTAATQKALQQADKNKMTILSLKPAEKEPAPKPCTDMKVSRTVNVSYRSPKNLVVQQGSQAGSECKLTITIDVTKPTHTFGVSGFAGDAPEVPTEQQCDRAVCFRLASTYHITATAIMTQKNTTLGRTAMEFDVIAPRPDRIGFVRFNRRAFVQNTTTIQWTNGVVSHFAAKNPSEVLGFFSLPTALLGSVALTVPLVK
jgi:hypothetical protein